LKKGLFLLQTGKQALSNSQRGYVPMIFGDRILTDRDRPSSSSSKILLEMGEYLQLVRSFILLRLPLPHSPPFPLIQALLFLTHSITSEDAALTAAHRINEIERYFLDLQSRYSSPPSTPSSDHAHSTSAPTPSSQAKNLFAAVVSSDDRYEFLAIKFCLKRIQEHKKKMKPSDGLL
jgi:hypothetical protein